MKLTENQLKCQKNLLSLMRDVVIAERSLAYTKTRYKAIGGGEEKKAYEASLKTTNDLSDRMDRAINILVKPKRRNAFPDNTEPFLGHIVIEFC